MGREEQVEEREVLEAIFPEEIQEISETEFRIAITLDVPGEEEDEDDEKPGFSLHVRYPDEYPDQAPYLEVLANPNAPHYPYFSVAEDREQLLSNLNETIQENIGVAMIFSLVSALKENAEQLIQDRKDVEMHAQEEKAREAEREENKKFQGTPVNPETFVEWREGFLKEMEEERQRAEEERLAELKKARVKEPVKLTGRQLWEKGLVGKVEEGDEDDIPIDGVENLKLDT